MADFSFESDGIALPKGAWAKTHRRRLRHGGRTLLALTQGEFRTYVYPLCTPEGFCVTCERPADHPHHSSLWIGADHVHALHPAAAGTLEEYTYNFYVEETFQGRAPGRIVELSVSGTELADGRYAIVQEIEWRGPAEWAAPQGRRVALERRAFMVIPGKSFHRIDVASRLSASDSPIRLGPTRHAYLNVRVADSMIVANGGIVRDDRGRIGAAAVSGEGVRWVDFTGPVGGGRRAGVTVIARPCTGRTPCWFVADWGVITVGPFRSEPLQLDADEAFVSRWSVLVHDGEADDNAIEAAAGRDTGD